MSSVRILKTEEKNALNPLTFSLQGFLKRTSRLMMPDALNRMSCASVDLGATECAFLTEMACEESLRWMNVNGLTVSETEVERNCVRLNPVS